MQTRTLIILITVIVFLCGGAYIVYAGRPAAQLSNNESQVEQGTIPTTTTSEQANSFTLSEISIHSTQEDCWTAINGEVYDLSSFVSRHPGGVNRIMQLCGIDGTTLFTQQHGQTKKAQAMLALLKIGALE